MKDTTNKIIYWTLLAVIVGLITYIMITQPKVKAGNEVLEINAKIKELENSIKEHQTQHKNAVEEKENCINQCVTSWDKQANNEHLAADADRAEIAALNERLGLLMERAKLQ